MYLKFKRGDLGSRRIEMFKDSDVNASKSFDCTNHFLSSGTVIKTEHPAYR